MREVPEYDGSGGLWSQKVDSDRAVRYVVRTAVSVKRAGVQIIPIHSAELQSAETRFTLKLREWNTWLFESAARNRVHVETASFITPAARHATDGRHLRRMT